MLFMFYCLQTVLSYFYLGIFYFVNYIICQLNFGTSSAASSIIMSIYLFIIIFSIIASLKLKPKRVTRSDGKVIYTRTMIYKILSFILGFYNVIFILGFYNVIAFVFGIYTIFDGGLNPTIKPCTGLKDCFSAYKDYIGALFLVVVGLSNFFLPLIIEPSMICTWFMNFFQYLFFQPTYAIILNIFAVCNIDDVSWGNRDSSSHIGDDVFKKYKINYLFVWLILNFILGWGFSYVVTTPYYILNGTDKLFINTYSILVAVLAAFKLICFMIGKFKYCLIDKGCRKLLSFDKPEKNNQISERSNLNEQNGNQNSQENDEIKDEQNVNIIKEQNSKVNHSNNKNNMV